MKDKMILYHGSDHEIIKPELTLGKQNNDYGQGFYLSDDIELAREWACKNNNQGTINEYELNLKDLKVLDLNDEKYNVLNWITILVQRRKVSLDSALSREVEKYLIKNFDIDISEYDVIIGYRSDDSYFSFVRSFMSGNIPLEVLNKSYRLGNLGLQYALVSEKAFKNIKFKVSQIVDEKIYYDKYTKRDYKARSNFKEISNEYSLNGLYALDIIRGGIKNEDDRLQSSLQR